MFLQIPPPPNERSNNNLSSFRNEATAIIPSSLITLQHMKNQVPVITPSMSINCSIHHLHHLVPPSIPLLEHNQRQLPPLVHYAIDTVIRRPSASGTVLGFVLIAKKWDTQYTIATSFVKTSSALILVYCTVSRVSSQDTPPLHAALFFLIVERLSSLESLKAIWGIMLRLFHLLSELFSLSLLSGCFCYLFLISLDPEFFLIFVIFCR